MRPKIKDGQIVGWAYDSSMGWDEQMEEIKNHFDEMEYQQYLEKKWKRESE